jgi:hypothetical protein
MGSILLPDNILSSGGYAGNLPFFPAHNICKQKILTKKSRMLRRRCARRRRARFPPPHPFARTRAGGSGELSGHRRRSDGGGGRLLGFPVGGGCPGHTRGGVLCCAGVSGDRWRLLWLRRDFSGRPGRGISFAWLDGSATSFTAPRFHPRRAPESAAHTFGCRERYGEKRRRSFAR